MIPWNLDASLSPSELHAADTVMRLAALMPKLWPHDKPTHPAHLMARITARYVYKRTTDQRRR